jgi:hypothetical protein
MWKSVWGRKGKKRNGVCSSVRSRDSDHHSLTRVAVMLMNLVKRNEHFARTRADHANTSHSAVRHSHTHTPTPSNAPLEEVLRVMLGFGTTGRAASGLSLPLSGHLVAVPLGLVKESTDVDVLCMKRSCQLSKSTHKVAQNTQVYEDTIVHT